MFYNQYPYNIFDPNAIEVYIKNQQMIEQHHNEQQRTILEMRKAIADYCSAARKITLDYQQQAFNACLDEIMIQAIKDGYNV